MVWSYVHWLVGISLLFVVLERLFPWRKGQPLLRPGWLRDLGFLALNGHLFSLLDKRLSAASLTLFAPACTVDFATRHYGAAIQAGKLAPGSVHVDIMDDEREQADTVGPYGKSLLYLVSRALEARHKTPLLGMEWAWKPDNAPEDQWPNDPGIRAILAEWSGIAAGMSLRLHGKRREYVSTGAGRIKLAHGSFDNDVEVVGDMLLRMRGGDTPLVAKVENLAY